MTVFPCWESFAANIPAIDCHLTCFFALKLK